MPFWPKAASVTPDGSFALRDAREAEAVAHLIGRSFAGTIDHVPELSLDWMIGPHLPRGHPLRVETVTFFMKIGVAQQGDALTLASHDDDGALCGVTICRRMESGRKGILEPLASGWRTFATIAWAIASGKMPAFYTSGEHKELRRTAMGPMDKRKASVTKTMATIHATHAPGPHYYAAIVAVDPPHQKRGHTGRMVRELSRLADAEGLPCYLEASGEANRELYRHLGYEVVGTYAHDEPAEPDWPDMVHFYAMVRPARAATK